MYRIYFDANARYEDGRFDLAITGSLKDIGLLAEKLQDGMLVQLYDYDGLELQATLEYDRHAKRWTAHPIWETLKQPPSS